MAETAIATVATAVSKQEIISLAETARDYADAGMAANTRRAYRSDFADFASWCSSVGACPLPADAATLALYLTARAPFLAVSTLERRLAAIRAAHLAEELTPPASAKLAQVWSGIRRTHGRPPKKKRGLKTDDLKRVLRRLPGGLPGLRDRALLLLGFAGALRREELAAASLDADAEIRLQFVSEGIEIHVGRAKGDQVGRGRIIAIPYGRSHCPVGAVRDWLEASNTLAGPVFRAIDRHGHVAAAALTGKSVARVVKLSCQAVGLPPADFAGHSLRRGMITSAADGGAAPEQLMRHARHAKFDTTAGYIEEADRFRKSAAGRVGL